MQHKWEGEIKWKWMLPRFKNSSDLKLEEENNCVKVIRKAQLQGSAVCESILNNSLVYSIVCTFNKPIFSKEKKFYEYKILIGLIPDNKI